MKSDAYSHSPLLSSLTDEALSGLKSLGQMRHYSARKLIYAQGEPGDSMLVLETGRVEISRTSTGGRRSVINHMGPGEVVGEIAMLDRGERSADVTAATEVTAFLISRTALLAFLQNNPEAALAMIGEICAKVRNASDMFEAKSEINGEARLARCLLRIAEKWGVGNDQVVTLTQGFSQTDLAEFSGLARENVNRHLRRWNEGGLIEHDTRNRILVLSDLAALRELAAI